MDRESDFTSLMPRDLPFYELKEITNGFSDDQKLGSGGFGVVYKGVLKSGQEIAVKKLYQVPGLDDKQFRSELENLMKLQHQNIVQLVGYCYEIRHRYVECNGKQVLAEIIDRVICLEYLCNGSLEKHLSDESCGLDWQTRYEIIKGVCEGLKYLHVGRKDCIYHLDLKPANILLDKNLIPKIADFGLSRLFEGSQTHITKNIIGTRRYMPTEYIDHGIISKKVDVFSLGVIIIEIMAGPGALSKSVYMPPHEFVDLVYGNWRNRLKTAFIDSSLEFYCQQVKRCIAVALNCVVADWKKRPSVVDIVQMLNNDAETDIKTLSSDLLHMGLNPKNRGIVGGDYLDNVYPDLVLRKELKLMVTSCGQSEKGSQAIHWKNEVNLFSS